MQSNNFTLSEFVPYNLHEGAAFVKGGTLYCTFSYKKFSDGCNPSGLKEVFSLVLSFFL
ncbi:MAG: hypothetical protein IJC19_01635 [Clostridia bacterium]|nr:hypothetical protein [Clostridia bacterium]